MEIALFPLPNLVVFPSTGVPLHIFEERYKLMINQCIDAGEPFGVVLLRAGAAEESELSIHRTGATARVLRAERLAEGRMNIVCRVEERFRILRFTQRIPFWKGDVEFFEDEDAGADYPSLAAQATELYRRVYDLSVKLEGSEAEELVFPDAAIALSFMLSYVLDIDSEQKQKLLEMTSTRQRLSALLEHLQAVLDKLDKLVAQKAVAQKVRNNGFLPH